MAHHPTTALTRRADRSAADAVAAPRLLVLRNYIVYRTLEALPHRLPRAGLLPASRSASASGS
jgi:hypothetical protein